MGVKNSFQKHVDWEKATEDTNVQSANKSTQSAKLNDELSPKCKNCTLEEVAVLRIMQSFLMFGGMVFLLIYKRYRTFFWGIRAHEERFSAVCAHKAFTRLVKNLLENFLSQKSKCYNKKLYLCSRFWKSIDGSQRQHNYLECLKVQNRYKRKRLMLQKQGDLIIDEYRYKSNCLNSFRLSLSSTVWMSRLVWQTLVNIRYRSTTNIEFVNIIYLCTKIKKYANE